MPRLNRLPAAFAVLFLLAFTAAAAHADLRIDITQGTVQPMPIAVVDFYGQQPNDAQSGTNIAGVVSADLERSGLFKPIDKKAFIQTPDSLRTMPRFADWRAHQAAQGEREDDRDDPERQQLASPRPLPLRFWRYCGTYFMPS